LETNNTLTCLRLEDNEIKDAEKRKIKEIWKKTRGSDDGLYI